MTDGNNTHQESDSSVEQSHHEDRIYYCYRCEREFSSNELTANCIYCNEGFITEMTTSNFNSDDDSYNQTDLLIDYTPLENESSDSISNYPNVSFDIGRIDENNGSSADGRYIRLFSSDGNSQNNNHQLTRNIRHVLEILEQFNPHSEIHDRDFTLQDYNTLDFNNTGNLITDLLARFRPILEENVSSSANINILPTVKVDASNSEQYVGVTCLICRDEFVLDDKLKILPCKHEFHDECVVTWLRLRDSCPVCRKKINETT